MKKLSDILLEAETLERVKTIAEDVAVDNSNTIIPPITSVTADRIGSALQKLDQIGEMADDLYNTFSNLEEIDAETDAALTGAYNSIDDLYAKIDDKYDIIPVDLDEYDIEEDLELFTDVETIVEKLSPDAPASEWIDDFVKSDAPQFKGKSKKERIKMALGAYYGAQKNEELELEESFSPGYDMVPAPIGKDTYQADGLRKLWGVKMRAGKWADTFVAMYADGKIGIVNDQGTNRYSTVADFEKGFKKFRKSGNLDESVNLSKIKELVSLALIDEKDVPATIAALKATQSDKALTPAQTKLLGNLAVMLTNVILGDTSALSSVKRAAKE
jgi:hypothetical protein